LPAIRTPLDERNVQREFYEFLKTAKLPRVRVHDLRHSCATMLLAVGEHPKVAAWRDRPLAVCWYRPSPSFTLNPRAA
jgi:integrase